MIRKLTAPRGRASASLALAFASALACSVSVKAQSASRATQAAAASRASADSLSAKERAEVFEEVWKTINEKYYDPSFNGVDWTAVRERYRPRVDSLSGDEEFYELLNRMAGELRDAALGEAEAYLKSRAAKGK